MVKQVSIKNVADRAGVSIATVSRCINDPDRVLALTRAKVEEAIAETGYEPNTIAQSFRRGHTNIIMVVLPSIGDPFFTEVIQGIRSVIDARGYSVVINETQFNTMKAREIGEILVSRQADGVILLASVFPFGSDVLSKARRRGQPIVIGCEVISAELEEFPSVHIDDVAAGQEATEFLISKGHSQIAFITGQASSLLTKDRERGYVSGMQAAGFKIEPGWIVEGRMTLDGAGEATRSLLEHQLRPTAIFCANDEMAMGCMHAIQRQGMSVPDDISVMGFDDIRYAAVSNPPLTTIAQPARDIGERTAQKILDAIESRGERTTEPEIVTHTLIVRESVAELRS
jgi:LacI family repressor for deo operon, udp, cdd, tsx, nupC, and nupG